MTTKKFFFIEKFKKGLIGFMSINIKKVKSNKKKLLVYIFFTGCFGSKIGGDPNCSYLSNTAAVLS